MTWARLDDGFWRNPKIEALTANEFRLYVTSIAYSADQLTDGLIDAKAMRYLGLSCSLARPGAVAKGLLSAGLWLSEGDCYRIHDYFAYNPSKADIQAKRAADAERKRNQRHGGTPSGTPGGTPGGSHGPPVPAQGNTRSLRSESVSYGDDSAAPRTSATSSPKNNTPTPEKSIRAIRTIINGHGWDPQATDPQSMLEQFTHTTRRIDHTDLPAELAETLLTEWQVERDRRLEATQQ